eukprot:m.58170 g.58170  ORF g.58170 m.58170 type:complete len:737 (+) comp9396_c0_seq1:183-2393(+)
MAQNGPPDAGPVAVAGSTLMGRYRIERHLGSGAYGSCWVATDLHSPGKPLRAIKQVFIGAQGDAAKKVEQEARLLTDLKHVHILRALESFMAGGVFNIVTDFCDDGDLSVAIEKQRGPNGDGPKFPESQVLDWTLQLGLALQYMHERRILHRDVKTKNVFLIKSAQGRRLLKLGDFGIARTLMDTAEQATSLAGTPLYMSPECLQCHGYGPKSDQWAFGVVIWEVCLLEHPFTGQSLMGLLYKICESNLEVNLPAEYSKDLAALLMKLVDRDPLIRPSAREVLETPVVQAHALASMELGSQRRQSTQSTTIDEPRLSQSLGAPPAKPVSLPPLRPSSGRTDSPARSAPQTNDSQFLSPRERAQRRKAEKAAQRAQELSELAERTAAENKARFSAERERLHIGSRDSSIPRPTAVTPGWPSSLLNRRGVNDDEALPDEGTTWSSDRSGVTGTTASSVSIPPSSHGGSAGGPVWPPPSRDGPRAVWAGSTLGSTMSTLASTLHIDMDQTVRTGGNAADDRPIRGNSSNAYTLLSNDKAGEATLRPTDSKVPIIDPTSPSDFDSPILGSPTFWGRDNPSLSHMRPVVSNDTHSQAGTPPIGVAPSPSDDGDDYSDDFESDDDDDSVDADDALREAYLPHLNVGQARHNAPVNRAEETWEEAPVGTRETQLQRLENLAINALGQEKFDRVRKWLREVRVAKSLDDVGVQQYMQKTFASNLAEEQGCFHVDQLVYLEMIST